MVIVVRPLKDRVVPSSRWPFYGFLLGGGPTYKVLG